MSGIDTNWRMARAAVGLNNPNLTPEEILENILRQDAIRHQQSVISQPPYIPPTVVPKTPEEIKDMENRALAFRLNSATNGLPTAQYNVGVDYLSGQNGLPKNKDLGEYWIRQSAAQDNMTAVDKLKELKPNAWEMIIRLDKQSITNIINK